MATLSIADRAERLMYRIAGLPVALSALWASTGGDPTDPLQSAFVWRYWHPDGAGEWSELVGGLVAWPLAVVLASLWFTWRNGAIVRSRHGKKISAQLAEQLRLYFSSGVLAPWYYIFSLHDADGSKRARGYIHRFETKPCYFLLLKRRGGSPLNDKLKFERHCAQYGVPCVTSVLHIEGQMPAARLPDHDLFVKPAKGRGGRGAERWDRVGPGLFASPVGERCTAEELLGKLVERSRSGDIIVQPRLRPHSELAEITSGALPTVRVVTCLDEGGQPEVVAAMFRSSIGTNTTVDNMHAGGMGALVDIATGKLSRASNLGFDERIGWFSHHPDTGAPIESRRLPYWKETMQLARQAHLRFDDRVVVGWDIAILDGGPILIEGNGNPDLDILQRFMPVGFRHHRFGELLGHHLKSRMPAFI